MLTPNMVNKRLLITLAIVALFGLLGITVTDSIIMPPQQVAGDKSPIGQCASGFKNTSSQLCKNLG
jgi:hypothetical protein